MAHHRTREVRARLARVHGHVHAVFSMLDEARPYREVLQQLKAVRAALDKATALILDDLIHECGDAPRRDAQLALDTLRAAIKSIT